MNTTTSQHVDIAIIGGGMVGLSFALALREAIDAGLRVAVIEPVDLPIEGNQPYQPSFDGRVTALSYGSHLIFNDMNVWQTLSAHATPIKNIHVSEKGHFGSVKMNHTQARVDALGYVVENAWLGQALHQQAKQLTNLTWICPAQVDAITMQENSADITITKNEQPIKLTASLTIIADGGRSALCEQLGISHTRHPYEQHAIIAVIETDKAHNHTAYERFTPTGPMALLPLAKNKMGVVWSVAESEANHVMQLSDDAFLTALQNQFGYRLGGFKKVGVRKNYPLNLIKREEQVRTGLVVLGNAAHTLHPVAGQGFNLALRDAANLASLLLTAFSQNQSLSDITLLQRYQQQQQADQDKTIGFSHATTTLFSSSRISSLIARRLGFMAMQVVPFAKSWFIDQAMGLGGPRANLSLQKRNPS